MNKKFPIYLFTLFCIWALLLIISIVITLNTKDIEKCKYYDEKVEAAILTKKCEDKIKEYKIDHGIALSKQDTYESGMLGVNMTYITTTLGSLDAKKTSINPDFAAVAIDMFKEAGLKKGDEIGCTFSGSFPAINLSVMCAIEVFGLKPVIMASVGASNYGANDPNFHFIDMVEYLNSIDILRVKVDYASLGGGKDIGESFDDVTGKMTEEEMTQLKESIINRIKESNTILIEEEDFETNVKLRMKYFNEKIPNMKLFINVGGNTISIGSDSEGFISSNGLITPTTKNLTKEIISGSTGLIDRYLKKGVSIAQFLNIKGLALKYDLPYNPVSFGEIGEGNVYYQTDYNLTMPITALVISIGFIVLIIYLRKKKNYEI